MHSVLNKRFVVDIARKSLSNIAKVIHAHEDLFVVFRIIEHFTEGYLKGYCVTQKLKPHINLDSSCNSAFHDILVDKMNEYNF